VDDSCTLDVGASLDCLGPFRLLLDEHKKLGTRRHWSASIFRALLESMVRPQERSGFSENETLDAHDRSSIDGHSSETNSVDCQLALMPCPSPNVLGSGKRYAAQE
jgi:hypothetical protein